MNPTKEPTRGEAAELNWNQFWQDGVPLKAGWQPFTLQVHVRGLTKEETELTLEEIVQDTNHSIHFDLRLATDRFKGWIGGTLFAGRTEDNRDVFKVFEMQDNSTVKLEGAIKQFGPIEWIKLAHDKPFVSGPKEVGATSNRFAKFFEIDYGEWHLGFARLHAMEIWLRGQKLKGRFMWTYAPLGGDMSQRSWLFLRPTDQEPYSSKHSLDKVVAELVSKNQNYLVWPENEDNPTSSGMKLIETAKHEPTVQRYKVIRSDPLSRFTLGVVYSPNEPDSYGTWASADQIQTMAWRYAAISREVNVQHETGTSHHAAMVESYISRVPDYYLNGQLVRRGAWIMGTLWDEQAWEHIQRGSLRGFSIGGAEYLAASGVLSSIVGTSFIVDLN